MATKAPPRSHVDPDCIYTLEGFRRVTGLAQTRMREARLQGLDIPRLTVGKRVFIRGRDAIEYIEKLAELSARNKANA